MQNLTADNHTNGTNGTDAPLPPIVAEDIENITKASETGADDGDKVDEGDKVEGSEGSEGAEAAGKTVNRSKLFVVFGEVHEFQSKAQAEKFLNEREAAPFQVLRGHRIDAKQKVSLRG